MNVYLAELPVGDYTYCDDYALEDDNVQQI